MSNPPRGAVAAIAGLAALVIGHTQLPDSGDKGSRVVAPSSAGFGVIGAIVGACFGVNASHNAARDAAQRALQSGLPPAERRLE